MKLNKAASELLNRYLLGVKRELGGAIAMISPQRSKAISAIYWKHAIPDQEIGTAELEAVLKEMGSPRKLPRSIPHSAI
jgi:hypothetical protein